MNKMKKIEIKRKIYLTCSTLFSIEAILLSLVTFFTENNFILQTWIFIALSLFFSWLSTSELLKKIELYWDAVMNESLLYMRAIIVIKRYAVFSELPEEDKEKLIQFIDLQYEGARKQAKEFRKENGMLTEIEIE